MTSADDTDPQGIYVDPSLTATPVVADRERAWMTTTGHVFVAVLVTVVLVEILLLLGQIFAD